MDPPQTAVSSYLDKGLGSMATLEFHLVTKASINVLTHCVNVSAL